MTRGDVSLILQSMLAESLTNVSSTNANTPSHHVKKEGWTEVFGNNEIRAAQAKSSSSTSTTSKNGGRAQEIQLIQYRPDWGTQLVLRMYDIPHTVMNTPYLSNQTTGSYPQYKHLNDQIIIGNAGILPHLFEKYPVDGGDDDGNVTGGTGATSGSPSPTVQCYTSMIHELNLILKALRYGDDNVWDSIYRKQCIRASVQHRKNLTNAGDGSGSERYTDSDSGWHAHAWFQAWVERIVQMKQSKVGNYLHYKCTFVWDKSNGKMNQDAAIAMASERYKSLNAKMDVNTMSLMVEEGKRKITGTSAGKSLTSADVLLFAHMAEALCDLHLVGILKDCKNLISFFQNTYETYFGKAYQARMKKDVTWIKENNIQNALNQFNRLPLNESLVTRKVVSSTSTTGTDTSAGGYYQDAIRIMQSVAMHCHDLQEILVDVSVQKQMQDDIYASESNPQKRKPGWMFQILRMGGDPSNKAKMNKGGDIDDGGGSGNDDEDKDADETTKRYNQQAKKIMREAKKNDELWLSGVICATVIGLLAATSKTSN